MLKKLSRVVAMIVTYPILFFSFLIPRSPQCWVFGSNNGFGCNAKYLFIEVTEKHPEIKAIWITRSKTTLKKTRAMGIQNSYYYLSIPGIFYLLTASKYITTHDLHRSLSLWTIGRAKWINLWHGVGIKSLRFKAKTSPLNKIANNPLLKFLTYPLLLHLFYRPDLFLVTSPLMAQHFKECFNLDDKNLYYSNYPRCAPLNWEKEQLKKFIMKYEPNATQELISKISSYNKIYLYMPTWRKSGSKFGIDLDFDFNILNNFLQQKNALFLIKLHPYIATSCDLNKFETGNIRFLEQDLDLYAFLPFSDTLITDYSSVYYDYLLMPNKEVLLYPFDYEDFITNSRDLAFDYDTYTPGKRAYSFLELMTMLENDALTSTNSDELKRIKQLFWEPLPENKNLIQTIMDL